MSRPKPTRPKKPRRPRQYRVVLRVVLWAEPCRWRTNNTARPEDKVVREMLKHLLQDFTHHEVYSAGGTSFGALGEKNVSIVSWKPLTEEATMRNRLSLAAGEMEKETLA